MQMRPSGGQGESRPHDADELAGADRLQRGIASHARIPMVLRPSATGRDDPGLGGSTNLASLYHISGGRIKWIWRQIYLNLPPHLFSPPMAVPQPPLG